MAVTIDGDAPLTGRCRVSLGQAMVYTRGRPIEAVVPIVYEAALELEIDPSFAIAEAILETGWGTSTLARTRHNWYGYQANYEDPSRARNFTSDEQGVRTALETMATQYFSPGGRHYRDGRGATLDGWAELWVDGGQANWHAAARHIAQIMAQMMALPPEERSS